LVYSGSAQEKRLPTRYADYPLRAGDAFRLDTPGGGYGDPLMRDPERVLADVRDGAVTVEAAQRDYGVVVTGGAGSWVIDAQGTRALRARMQQAVGAGRLRSTP
jgi:N-methylhydantoinase B